MMRSPSTRLKIIALVAGAHLTLVAIGASFSDILLRTGAPGRVLARYSSASGADSGYSFFAPGVGSQLRARFQIISGDTQTTHVMETGKSHEADLRIDSPLDWFWREGTNRKLQRSMAASWAGKMFGRYADAQKVRVELEAYLLPDMAGYRDGLRPGWEPFYEATFVRR